MKKTFIAVGVASLLGLTSVAQAIESNWYGSIRAGLVSDDSGDLDIGATGSDGNFGGQGLYSRIGVNASTDLGNGQSAGAKLEIGVRGGSGKNLSIRHKNVWIGGGWGKLTFGQQGNPYRAAANWDQSWTLGGQVRHYDGGTRLEGISYASNLGGPFSFDLTATGNEANGVSGVDRWIATAHYDVGGATINLGYNKNNADSAAAVIAAPAAVSNSMTGTITPKVEAKDAVLSYDSAVISVNGSVGDFGYYVAYEQSNGSGLPDTNIGGLFLSYDITASDRIYFEYEKSNTDGVFDDRKNTLFGYSHSLGDGVTFIAEHTTIDPANNTDTNKVLNLFLKVTF